MAEAPLPVAGGAFGHAAQRRGLLVPADQLLGAEELATAEGVQDGLEVEGFIDGTTEGLEVDGTSDGSCDGYNDVGPEVGAADGRELEGAVEWMESKS